MSLKSEELHPTVCQCDGITRVIDSRKGEMGLRRRRECLSCGQRWTTYEVRSEAPVRIQLTSLIALRQALTTIQSVCDQELGKLDSIDAEMATKV